MLDIINLRTSQNNKEIIPKDSSKNNSPKHKETHSPKYEETSSLAQFIKTNFRGISINVFALDGSIFSGRVIFPDLNSMVVLINNGITTYIVANKIVAFSPN